MQTIIVAPRFFTASMVTLRVATAAQEGGAA